LLIADAIRIHVTIRHTVDSQFNGVMQASQQNCYWVKYLVEKILYLNAQSTILHCRHCD